MTLTLIGQSAPTFWIGIMLILAFGLELRWFPIGGRGTLSHWSCPLSRWAPSPWPASHG